ncbi:MAG: hypothetical protein PHY45_01280 [Rhodocyclaceae bacterium]|nr:hypothetical protein [Rhodocyclaceae bacterium]
MKTAGRLLAAAIVAVACAPLPRLPVVSPQGREALDQLEYFERLSGLPVEQQNVEYGAAKAAFEREPSDANRLRLALALSLPQTPWHDDAKVVLLLAAFEPSRKASGGPLRELAALVEQGAVERMRLRDEHRRREAAWRDEQHRIEELQQKLEALRAIDREMRQRAPPR